VSNLSSNKSVPLSVGTLGVPRIGPRRELKTALEAYWAKRIDADALQEAARGLRSAAWARQAALGITHVPSNDFSLYDHVLDTTAMVGAIPAIYHAKVGSNDLGTYFAMARGTQAEAGEEGCGHWHHDHGHSGVPALEMTKWFDTNYHFMVPQFARGQTFTLSSTKPIDEYAEAKALGYETRPVLVGPVTYLLLGKMADDRDPLSLLPGLLPVYVEVLRRLAWAGATSVQIDEPCLVLDIGAQTRTALQAAYSTFAREVPELAVHLTTYFGDLGDNIDAALSLPVAGLHLDLVRAPNQLEPALARARPDLILSLGIIDGRNVWRANLPAILDRLEPIVQRRGADRLALAPSCSLLHVPYDKAVESELDPEARNWLSFAVQKMEELSLIRRALLDGRGSVHEDLRASGEAAAARAASPRIHDSAVAARTEAVTEAMARRARPFEHRRPLQHDRLGLPAFPTTTIGSFPQTGQVRKARAAHARGGLDAEAYEAFLREETAQAVHWQEEVGLDVLVHGEFERNDMVQYFGERLSGFAFTKHGWVQSYGSRCVRPPILYGDVSRPEPMTVAWWRYAQSLTQRPMKGMLTGPVTILNWSFVRDDIPRSAACRQIALAIRDEVADLEAAGAKIIQIDEAALREGLPLRRAEWAGYLAWAVESFRLAASGVADETQIHTHMCYSEFNDIISAIGAMDADVISIETSRSRMELLGAFTAYRYPNEIGPGVYDIHSPRVPDTAEMVDLLRRARERLDPEQIWVNPDCGLKTRGWAEVKPALVNMVAAARAMREAAR
jgi:5-methyltetrahydropteroyltriglutamate--homocysteine methyltransferase